MGFGPIRDLIAHAGAELKATAIVELGLESASETEENVPFLAPMVGAVARRVLNHPDANRTEFAGTPAGSAGFAGILNRAIEAQSVVPNGRSLICMDQGPTVRDGWMSPNARVNQLDRLNDR